MTQPYVLLSVATSIDGCIDDTGPDRLLLSNAADFDRVDQVRADSDAILIGAGTIRADNPRLIVYSDERRAARVARGFPEYPLKVTVSASGKLDKSLNFWHHGGEKLVYTTDDSLPALREELTGLAEVVSLGAMIDWSALLGELGDRGVQRLMVEGGGSVHTALLSRGLVDEINLAIAPIVVGEQGAPHFLNSSNYAQSSTQRMTLAEAKTIGDIVLLRYLAKEFTGE
ncbi:MAG: RibD family protein [Pseudonocardia sp.]